MRTDLAALCEQQLTKVRESGALAVFENAAPALREALPSVLAASDFVVESLARESSRQGGATLGLPPSPVLGSAAPTRAT